MQRLDGTWPWAVGLGGALAGVGLRRGLGIDRGESRFRVLNLGLQVMRTQHIASSHTENSSAGDMKKQPMLNNKPQAREVNPIHHEPVPQSPAPLKK